MSPVMPLATVSLVADCLLTASGLVLVRSDASLWTLRVALVSSGLTVDFKWHFLFNRGVWSRFNCL